MPMVLATTISDSDQTIKALAERAGRLAEQVERATRASTNQEVRREGARFAEVLEEWLEDILELHKGGDDRVKERIQSFSVRLRMAEEKVKAWWAPFGGLVTPESGAETRRQSVRKPQASRRSELKPETGS